MYTTTAALATFTLATSTAPYRRRLHHDRRAARVRRAEAPVPARTPVPPPAAHRGRRGGRTVVAPHTAATVPVGDALVGEGLVVRTGRAAGDAPARAVGERAPATLVAVTTVVLVADVFARLVRLGLLLEEALGVVVVGVARGSEDGVQIHDQRHSGEDDEGEEDAAGGESGGSGAARHWVGGRNGRGHASVITVKEWLFRQEKNRRSSRSLSPRECAHGALYPDRPFVPHPIHQCPVPPSSPRGPACCSSWCT